MTDTKAKPNANADKPDPKAKDEDLSRFIWQPGDIEIISTPKESKPKKSVAALDVLQEALNQ